MKTIFAYIFLLTLIASLAQGTLTTYSELRMKNFDEMYKVVQAKITEARNISKAASAKLDAIEGDPDAQEESEVESDQKAIDILRETMRWILSRPDQDNLVAKLYPSVRRELNNYNAYDDAVAGIVTEAISGLQQKKLKAEIKATYLVILENIMAELKPEIDVSPAVKKMFQKIQNAEIEVPSDVQTELKLRSMETAGSPSDSAEKSLETAQKKKNNSKK